MKEYNCSQELMEDFDFVHGTVETQDFAHTANS